MALHLQMGAAMEKPHGVGFFFSFCFSFFFFFLFFSLARADAHLHRLQVAARQQVASNGTPSEANTSRLTV